MQTIPHYSRLFGTIRHYSHCSYYSLFAVFVLFAIRDYSLFAIRYSRLFAIRYSGFPDTPARLLRECPDLRVVFHKIQTLAGQRTSPILLRFGMQSCFRVLTTKWMLKSSNSFYFGKYREGRLRVTMAARHCGGSKEFLLHQS